MQFSTLATITFATVVLGTGNTQPSVTKCQTLTSTVDPAGAFNTCIVLACIEISPITQKCGCSTIPTTSVTRTACPTSCGATSYITAIEDCFPTPPPSSTTSTTSKEHSTTKTTSTTISSSSTTTLPSSTTKSSTHSPSSTSISTQTSHSPTTTSFPHQTPYTNTTRTVTKTEHTTTTLTTCPAKHACTGQTITYTSTELCPTSTCVCVLPSVTYITTVLPVPTSTQDNLLETTTRQGNTPPSPTSRPSPTFLQSNDAGKWGIETGLGMTAAFLIAFAGFL